MVPAAQHIPETTTQITKPKTIWWKLAAVCFLPSSRFSSKPGGARQILNSRNLLPCPLLREL